MKPLQHGRTILRGVSVAAIVLLASACIDEAALPAIDITPAMIVPSDPGPAVSAGPSAAEQSTTNYGPVSQFLGASDALADQRGVTNSASVGAKCAKTRGCVPGSVKPAASALDALATDVAAAARNGGSGTVVLQGNVDNQKSRITGAASIELARNRAAASAAELEAQLISQGVPARNILIGSETRDANCSAPGIVCIQTQVNPSVIASCRGRAICDTRSDAQRATTASAVTSVPTSSTTGIPVVGTFTPVGGAVSTSPAPNPGSGNFGPVPAPSSPGSPPSSGETNSPGNSGTSGPGDSGTSGPGDSDVNNPDDSGAYCDAYPTDCPDITDDELSVRITVAAPAVFRVGGRLREQNITVESVVLYCGSVPCSRTGLLRIGDFRGSLSLPSSSSSYRLCATTRSTNCAYYLSNVSTPTVSSNGYSIAGGLLRAGFITPTPSISGPAVKVRPTLDVSVLEVDSYIPVWVGGTGCDAHTPERSCWEWDVIAAIDMRDSVSVRTSDGASFVRSGAKHSIERIVVGTVGS